MHKGSEYSLSRFGLAFQVASVEQDYRRWRVQRILPLIRIAIMASMLKSVDECFSRILDELDKHGLTDNTLIIFTSDNGGNTHSNIVCPLHRWTYDLQGQLIGAPHFTESPCLHLNNYKTRSWNGLVFEDNGRDIAADLACMGPRSQLNFDGYALDRVELHECNYNWKTFIEVYLEDYHVGPFHPGLGRFVTCDDLKWEFSPHHSVQTVGINDSLRQAGSPAYKRWHAAVLALGNGQPPKQGAIWLTYYPHIMVEWYPHVLTVSTLHPISADKTLNMVEFYYPEEIAAFEREFVEAQRAAYMETCIEDDEIAERMDAGRKALLARGDNEVGPYQSPMEDGMQHFHEWYRRQLGASLRG